MRGWFDAFRTGGGPTLYDSERTAATHDNILLGLYATFGALFLAFLVIIPGFRNNKIPTFILLTGSMFVLATIVICQFSSHWHVSSSTILASYKYSSSVKLPGRIGVHVGLASFNVTLQLNDSISSADFPLDHRQLSQSGLNFNERYTWSEVDEVDKLHQDSLQRGYPSPILTVAETLAMDAGGFSWGRSYRLAGYYCAITLWCALAAWFVMNLLFCLVPRYSGYCALLTGGLCFLCDAMYAQLLPAPPLVIHFEQGVLVFGFGWNFWMILSAGFVCVLFGVGIIIADLFFPQIISEVHASWRHTFSDSQICSPQVYSTGVTAKQRSATFLSANCQITMDGLHHDPFRSPPIRRSTQWTPKDSEASMSDPAAATLVDDPYLEEIERATNLPRRTPLPVRKMAVEEAAVFPTAADTVIRDGLGYVNPVMWDINVQEHYEDRQAVFSTQSSSSDTDSGDADRATEVTRM